MSECDLSGVVNAAADLLHSLRDYEEAAWSADGMLDGMEAVALLTFPSMYHARLERELAALGFGDAESNYPFPAPGRPLPSRILPALQRLWRVAVELRNGAENLKDSLLLGWFADGKPPRLGQYVSMLEWPLEALGEQRSQQQVGNGTMSAGLSGEAKALAVLLQHPDWPDTRIAKECGCSRTTLYDWPKYKAARAVMKEGRNALPHGRKDAETGDVEAWE